MFCVDPAVHLTPAGPPTADRAPGDADAVERHPCPQCAVPAGSTCRTRSGRITARYHTARFALVPSLRDALTVAVPTDRQPGRPWTAGPELPTTATPSTSTPIRIGYVRTSAATQELASQLG